MCYLRKTYHLASYPDHCIVVDLYLNETMVAGTVQNGWEQEIIAHYETDFGIMKFGNIKAGANAAVYMPLQPEKIRAIQEAHLHGTLALYAQTGGHWIKESIVPKERYRINNFCQEKHA